MGSITVDTQQTNDFQYAVLEQKIGKKDSDRAYADGTAGVVFSAGEKKDMRRAH